MTIDEACRLALQEQRVISGLMCAACGGGKSRETSLSVWPHDTLPGTVVLHCWRNACGTSSTKHLDAVEAFHKPRHVSFPDSVPLSDAAKQFMLSRFLLHSDTLDRWQVRQHVYESALLLPVWGKLRQIRGYVLRRYGKSAEGKPKALSYKLARDGVWQSVYTQRYTPQSCIVVVEDQISAMRLWQLGYSAIALLGTSLSTDKLTEINSIINNGRVVIALDADAMSNAIGLVRHLHANLQAIRLWRDIKDSTDAEIAAALPGLLDV